MRQVFELSGNLTQANKDGAVQFTLPNDVDKIEGPATLNVVRVRCPSQFFCTGGGTVKVKNGHTKTVESFSSPAEAIQKYEKAMLESVLSIPHGSNPDHPKLTLENGLLKLECDEDFTFDDVAASRLNLGAKVTHSGSSVRIGTKSPAFNDVRRIVMTLTPTTQRIIAMDASSTNKLYDNASISFTVDDDPSDNSPMSVYSILSDFDTNALQIKSGSTENMSIMLQRCIFDPTTGVLGKPESLDLPYANNFFEVKLVADADEPTAKRQRLPSQQPLIPPQRRLLPGVPTPEDMRG